MYYLAPESETPRLLASFALPSLNWDPSSLLNSTFYPSSNRHGTPGGSLSGNLGHMAEDANDGGGKVACSPGHALVQLKMDLQYTLYTPLSTFLSVAEGVLHEIAKGHAHGHGYGKGIQLEAIVPWDRWSHLVRIIEEGNDSPIVCGYRAVYTDHILDFSPFDVATDSYGHNARADQAEDAAPTNFNGDTPTPHDDMESACEVPSEVITAPSTLHASMFAKPVVTSLPYRRTHFPFPGGMGRLASDMLQIVFEDVDGPKVSAAPFVTHERLRSLGRYCGLCARISSLFRHRWTCTWFRRLRRA